MRTVLLALAGVLTWAGTAESGVIYRWQNLQPNTSAGPANGILEIKDGLWKRGAGLAWSADVDEFGPSITLADSPIERFAFSVPDLPDPWKLPFGACGKVLSSGCSGPGDTTAVVSPGFLGAFDLMLLPRLEGSMMGQFDAGGGGSFFRMSSDGSGIWTLQTVVGDGGNECGFSPNACAGGTGMWVLDRTVIPEPTSLALLALGGLALAAGRKRRRRPD
jgi:hypothetical protein